MAYMENPGEVVLPITPNPHAGMLLLLHTACPWGHSHLHLEFEPGDWFEHWKILCLVLFAYCSVLPLCVV
jgi:hypothetical protein